MERQKYLIYTTPDKELLEDIVGAITDNGGYCCCAVEKTDDYKCMCKPFRDQEESGYCHCGRFYKVKNAETILLMGNCEYAGVETLINEYTEKLDNLGFIVTTIKYKEINSIGRYLSIRETNRTKIAKADLVWVFGPTEGLDDLMSWVEEIQKPCTTNLTLGEEKNED